jgi:hypothetical protein
MPNVPLDEQGDKPSAGAALNELVGKLVIHSLGTPKDLLKVNVHPVGGDRYRVNVVTGKDYTTRKIANSFFVTANAEGAIVSSIPPIVKLY